MEGPVTRQEFKEETDKIYGKLNRHDRQIAVIETLVENLKGLPSAINNLEKTMALMGQTLENLNNKVDSIVDKRDSQSKINSEKDREQDEKIRALDEKSKVDILVFVKTNWWKIVMTLAVLLVLIEKYIPI